jgi:hypothetical protein
MSFINDLLEKPDNLSTASKYAAMNGLIYLGAGALLIVWPGAVQTLLRDPAFVGHEGALFRVIGMAVAVIGWLYVFGGRSGAQQFGPASVLDRVVLVPLVLVPLVIAGVFPHTLGAFAILDPSLGIVPGHSTIAGRDAANRILYLRRKLEDRQVLTTSIGWVLIVSGIITAGGGLVAFLFPHFNLRSTGTLWRK